ncbi:MAG TPA: VWA domain-containing protein [Vicinamibacteria bacterium]|nr:VWA domain-containing protein [Vicinamibacteria bacterium]
MRLTLVVACLASIGVLGTMGVASSVPEKPTSPPPVVRISVERIQLDAVVTDKHGRHVTDLRPEDLEVYQDGRKQQLSELAYVRVGERAPAANSPEATRSEPGAAPAPSSVAPQRTILFVVDELSLSAHGFDSMRRALKYSIERLDANDRVDIVSTVRGFSTLALTTDRTANLAAVAGLRRTPWTRPELSRLVAAAPLSPHGYGADDPMRVLYTDGLRSPLGARYDGGVMFDLNARLALRSIAVVKEAVRALRDVPGRKALLLVSEGLASLDALSLSEMHFLYWPLDRLYGDADDLPGALKRLAEFAARAGVVIDVVDPRGLVSAGLNAEDKVEVTGAGLELGQEVQARHLGLFHEQSTLQYLADETGGLAKLDTNDMAGAVSSIVADLSGYYLIGYAPEAGTFDDHGFHSFEVKVKRPGLKVRTRKGFYAVTDEQVSSALP